VAVVRGEAKLAPRDDVAAEEVGRMDRVAGHIDAPPRAADRSRACAGGRDDSRARPRGRAANRDRSVRAKKFFRRPRAPAKKPRETLSQPAYCATMPVRAASQERRGGTGRRCALGMPAEAWQRVLAACEALNGTRFLSK
jgi:hypothetical protein